MQRHAATAGVLRVLIRVAMGCLAPCAALADIVPVGSEFQVNTYTPGDQNSPDVAVSTTGDFIIVWGSNGQDGDQGGIRAQRYASTGSQIGSEFQVNTFTVGPQSGPGVAVDGNGNAVVVWFSNGQDGSSDGMFGQRYDSAGVTIGTEFQINSYTPGSQGGNAVATSAAGDFVVIWHSDGQDGSSTGIFGQRFASNGGALGTEFQVNTNTLYNQSGAAVDFDSSGAFDVVWSTPLPNPNPNQIVGQRYSSAGARLGTEFAVTTPTHMFPDPENFAPKIDADPAGGFVVAWTSGQFFCGNCAYHPVGRRYDSAGNPVSPQFTVSNAQTQYPYPGDLAVAPDSGFVVVWSGYGGGGVSVLGQNLAPDDTRVGSAFIVNTSAAAYDVNSRVASNGSGNNVVVWSASEGDGSGHGVFARRFIFATPLPTLAPGTPSATPTATPPAPTRTPTKTLQAGCPPFLDVGCFDAGRRFLVVQDEANDAADLVKWKWTKGFPALAQSDFGNPVSGGTGYRVCIYDTTVGLSKLKFGAAIAAGGNCPTSPCWKTINRGYLYRNPDSNAQGITKIILKGGSADRPRVVVVGKGPNLAMPGPISGSEYFDQDPSIHIEIRRTDSTACWRSFFTSAIRNTAQQFRAR